jgi:signal transduction protein with GAF and PtsI domain
MSKPTQPAKKTVKTLKNYLKTVQELYWASQDIALADNLLYELNRLLYKVMNAVGAKDGSICRLDEQAGELVFMLVHGELGRQLPDYRIKSDTGIAGSVVKTHEPVIVNDPRKDKRFSQVVDTEFGFFTKSLASAPIMRRGVCKGVVQLLNKTGNEFDDEDIVLMLILGQVSAIVFEALETRGAAAAEEIEDLLA